MAINNPYIPGDPYSYDLKWIVAIVKEILLQLGTLDEAIEKKIFEGFVEHSIVQFHNVADMLAADIKDGSIVLTLGYYEAGDLGAMFYLIKDFNPGQCALDYFLTMDNNAQIAIPVVVTPYVTPEMFGAYGDGTHDDSNAFSITCKKGPKVVIAGKSYVLKQSIEVPDGVDIECHGTIYHDLDAALSHVGVFEFKGNNAFTGGTFVGTGAVTHYADTFDVLHGNGIKNVTIKDVTVKDTPYWGAIMFEACENILIENCTVKEYTYDGIAFVTGCKNSVIRGCSVINGNETTTPNRYPIMGNGYYGSGPYPLSENIQIIGNYVEDATPFWEGIDFHGGKYSTIKDNVIKNTYCGIAIVGDPNYQNYDVIIEGNVVELPASGTSLNKNNNGVVATRVTRMKISGNFVSNSGQLESDEIVGAATQIANGHFIDITDNIFQNCAGDGTYFNISDNITVANNVVEGVDGTTPKPFEFDGNNDRLMIHDNIIKSYRRAIYGPNGDYSYRNYFYNNRYDYAVTFSNMTYIIPDRIGHGLITNIKCGVQGDVIYNLTAASGQPKGWICTVSGVAGTPATWTSLGNL